MQDLGWKRRWGSCPAARRGARAGLTPASASNKLFMPVGDADEKHGGWLVPIFALAHENDPDPEMRPYKGAIGAEEREKLIVGAAAGVTGIYRHFEAQRMVEGQPFDSVTTFRRTAPKIGRNDPCPCGSGKKFKQCCGRTTLH